MSSEIFIKPFRWNVDKDNELGTLVDNKEVQISKEFRDELITSGARILAFADDSTLYFVGRSPENYFDFYSGIFADNKSLLDRFNLFQFSGRQNTIEELIGKYAYNLEMLKGYMSQIGLSPLQIINRKTNTAFVDVVSAGGTFEVLFQILHHWSTEIKADWNALKQKIRIVGITERKKNSPNTWRWQQKVDWIDLIGQSNVKNVSVTWDFWCEIANYQYKTTQSFYFERWVDEEVSAPLRKDFHIAGLTLARCIYKMGLKNETRSAFRKQLVKQKEIEHKWFKELIKILPQ